MINDFLPQYAAQAIIDLERTVKQLKPLVGDILGIQAHEVIISLMRNAVHVVLPENGEIYRSNRFGGEIPTPDECESFRGLPAPLTCFEYVWAHPKDVGDSTVGTRRITITHDTRQTHEGPVTAKDRFYTQIFSVYYHEVDRQWRLFPIVLNLCQPLNVRATNQIGKHGLKNWGIDASIISLTDYDRKTLGEMRADITAVIQCCHALRAGASLEEKRESSASRRWKFEKKGVGGFTYHVLTLPAHVRERKQDDPLGTHASPRAHIRRAHIRKLPTGTLAFVRQCFVGDLGRGVVQKTYQVQK